MGSFVKEREVGIAALIAFATIIAVILGIIGITAAVFAHKANEVLAIVNGLQGRTA